MLDSRVPIGTFRNISDVVGTRDVHLKDRDVITIDKQFQIEDWQLPVATDFHFKINYSFSTDRRKTVWMNKATKKYEHYGQTGMTFDRLYFLLCEAFNGGSLFIDTYFNSGLFQSKFKQDIHRITRDMQKEIVAEYEAVAASVPLTKRGAMDRRTRGYSKFSKLGVWKTSKEAAQLSELSEDIRRHIINCLATGKIDLQFQPSRATLEKREKLGLDAIHAFYASGQLINHLIIQYDVETTEV